jgi:hypothetical protein
MLQRSLSACAPSVCMLEPGELLLRIFRYRIAMKRRRAVFFLFWGAFLLASAESKRGPFFTTAFLFHTRLPQVLA